MRTPRRSSVLQQRWQILLYIVLGFAFFWLLLSSPAEVKPLPQTEGINLWMQNVRMTLRMLIEFMNKSGISLGLFIFIFLLNFWLFVMAQFTVPLRTLGDRFAVYLRLLRYLILRPCPAHLVEGGQVYGQMQQGRTRGLGVCILDSASAAMLRSDVAYTRAVGPGVVFTRNERIAGAVDLSLQRQIIGPRETENPFDARTREESEPAYQERQRRRLETSSLTRDAIEIAATISVTFRVATDPGEGNSPYGYNARIVRRVVMGEGVDPNMPVDQNQHHVPWNELPGNMAVQIWRNTVPCFTLAELFEPLDDTHVIPQYIQTICSNRRPTGLDFIKARLNQCLTKPEIDVLDAKGNCIAREANPTLQWLVQRGIKVRRAAVYNVQFDQTVESLLIQRWQSSWLQKAQEERMAINAEISGAVVESQNIAHQELAQALVQRLRKHASGPSPEADVLLRDLLVGTLRFYAEDAQLRQQTEMPREALKNMISELNQ